MVRLGPRPSLSVIPEGLKVVQVRRPCVLVLVHCQRENWRSENRQKYLIRYSLSHLILNLYFRPNKIGQSIVCIIKDYNIPVYGFSLKWPKMAPLNQHRHFTIIICFIWTDIHLKLFYNFHFDLRAHNLKIWHHKVYLFLSFSHFPFEKKNKKKCFFWNDFD